MPSTPPAFRRFRRSTRVSQVRIEALGMAEFPSCQGETMVVKLHGALISTTVVLGVGLRSEIHVCLTDKRAKADVVYIDPDQPLHCGIALTKTQNIWGVSFPPDDWHEAYE